jgi:ferredoxin
MNYTTVYFSATDTSKKSSVSIIEALAAGKEYRQVDLTAYDARETEMILSADDFIVFGVPVHNGRIPKVAAQRLNNIRGQQTPCIITVTYGNRDYDDALLELSDLVQANGFVVQAAAALIGQHTFGEIQVGRPNESDVKENHQFVKAFLELAENLCTNSVKLSIKGNLPYMEVGNGAGFHPQTADTCNKCGLCVKNCPMGAINSDCITIDSEHCISCFRCIRYCPSQSKNMNDSNYIEFAKGFSKQLAARRENEYFLPKK